MSDRFYEAPAASDERRSAPAALRNREPIAAVLGEWLPAIGTVLEIASGTGEHSLFFAERFPTLQFQPSDSDPAALRSIAAWREGPGLPNLLPPVDLDASSPDWPVASADAVLCFNMAHISPWEATLGVLDRASALLPSGGPLIFYGPWLVEGVETAPSNLAFDSDLKRRDPRWGLRRVEDLIEAAAQRGIRLEQIRSMPANNIMILLRRSTPPLNEALPAAG